ncbi:MAG: UbiH/UbiF/VisC/COQ6 family ubiquinone biosynthesis hydroxylase [Xanthomonadales bacterium]|nr:UbiH/UbiF/VisC/COQ6 family ubiquinone biosynthesis hydroxylase [Xanthomonadales bacterium]NNL95956.1 UbiH/UbiF/VisC/COQ6 family ubiquinone biosynthesis hydroxylase [Xanthomonadales bacterium]
MKSARSTFDVAVVGAGMVGATTACLLARSGFSVIVIESAEPAVFDKNGDVGLRVSALSPGSAAVLDAAGAWKAIEDQRHCPYRHMHIEDAENSASLDFEAPAFGMERLGTIVENELVQGTLWGILQSLATVEIHCPQRVTGLQRRESSVLLELDNSQSAEARLVVACDGAASSLRELAGIDHETWEYNQQGLVSVVQTELPNPGTAWQRFLPAGPLAFLPLPDGRSSIVWSCPSAETQSLLSLDEAAFNEALSLASGQWLGPVMSSGARGAFPLFMRLSREYVSGRIVLIGDAAHVVHPLAGQGVNLGLADAAALVETLLAERASGHAPGASSGLNQFAQWRKSESQLMAGGIHALRSLFMHEGLGGIRSLGLKLVSRSWFARETFLRRAAGQGRNAPGLARGRSLHALATQNDAD